jgi:hypothetical protein
MMMTTQRVGRVRRVRRRLGRVGQRQTLWRACNSQTWIRRRKRRWQVCAPRC